MTEDPSSRLKTRRSNSRRRKAADLQTRTEVLSGNEVAASCAEWRER